MDNKIISNLINFVNKLPNIGSRSATEIVINMIQNQDKISDLIKLLEDLRDNIKKCQRCGNFDTQDICNICNTRQNAKQLCVVINIRDLMNIERSDAFNGLYFVLGGCLSTMNSFLPKDLCLEKLFAIIQNNNIDEIIFALGSTTETQTTYFYVLTELEDFIKSHGLSIQISSLGF